MKKRFSLRSIAKPLTLAFVIALIVHLPFTPAFPLVRMLTRMSALTDDKKDWDYKEPKEDFTLPIELMNLPKVDPPAETSDNSFAPPPAAPASPAGPNDVTLADPTRAKPAAAATDKAKPNNAKDGDKKSPSAKFAAGSSPDDPSKEDEKDADGIGPGKKNKKKPKPEDKVAEKPNDQPVAKKETVGLGGTQDQKVIGKPNVTLALWLAPIRTHALGAAVGQMFSCAPEWKPFVAEGLKPLEDLEGVMVVGPQLSESSKATVAVEHHLSPERVHSAMEALIQHSVGRGSWMKDDVAKVVLQRRERIMFPHVTDMIFVAPQDSWQALHDVKEPLSLPPAKGRALSLTLQKPARPLHKLGLTLPERLEEMRLDVFANTDGSADMQIDFEDGSAEKAKEDAPKVEATLSTFFADLSQLSQTVDSLSLIPGDAEAKKTKLKLPDVDFDAVNQRITTMIHLGEAESGRILSLLAKAVCPKKKPAPKTP